MSLPTAAVYAAMGWLASQDGAVILRGPAVAGRTAIVPTAVSAAGVSVGTSGGAVEVLPWDRVREVSGTLAGEAEKFRSLADRSWRARIRLERGDLVSAEPLLEELFAETIGQPGPTAAGIAAELIRCRTERGAYSAAVKPWLGYLRSVGAQGVGVSNSDLGKIIDASTGLCPSMPPMWTPGSGVRQLADGLVMPPVGEKTGAAAEKTKLLGELYVAAARADSGLEATLPEIGTNADPGLRLAYDIVRSRLGDAAARRDARRLLTERIGPKSLGWVEVWCRVAIGRSLLKEQDEELRREGVLSLVYVASRGATTEGGLTGLALAEAAVGLDGLGDHKAATSLAAELVDRFAGHPAMDWPAVKALVPKRTPKAGP